MGPAAIIGPSPEPLPETAPLISVYVEPAGIMVDPQGAGRSTGGNLGYVGAALAYLVAGVHLFYPERGFPRLVTLLGTGDPSLLVYDPRPLLFVLSGIGVLLGVKLVILGVERERIYLLGMALMVAYFVGYFAWHLSGHGGFLPGREPLYHGLHPVEAVVAHLVGNPVVAIAKLAEAALFAVLAVLYRREQQGGA